MPQLTLQPGATLTVRSLASGSEVTGITVKVFQVVPPVAGTSRPLLQRKAGG